MAPVHGHVIFLDDTANCICLSHSANLYVYILKCRFCYLGLVKPRDQEKITLKRYFVTVPKRAEHALGPHWEEARSVRMQGMGVRGRCGQEALLWFLRQGRRQSSRFRTD